VDLVNNRYEEGRSSRNVKTLNDSTFTKINDTMMNPNSKNFDFNLEDSYTLYMLSLIFKDHAERPIGLEVKLAKVFRENTEPEAS
jgi:hypothetical protein